MPEMDQLWVKGSPCPNCGIEQEADQYGCLTNNCKGAGGSPDRPASPSEVLAYAATLDGAKRVLLPDSVYDLDSAGGEWSHYLVIPLPDKETP